MAQTQPLTKDQVQSLIADCFADLVATTEAEAVEFDDPLRDTDEQRRMITDRHIDLRTQIRSGRFETDIRATAARLLKSSQIDVDNASAAFVRDLSEGVARALVEQLHLQEFRLSDRLLDRVPSRGVAWAV